MKIIAELHTHTNEYCDHAGSSIEEFIEAAKAKGFKYYAATNHSAIIDTRTPHTFYLDNLVMGNTMLFLQHLESL